MAKVQFSTAVGDMRNKVGGAVFTKGRFGAFVRTKVSPVQPRSSEQMNVRANFTSLSKLWSDATMDTYRAAWSALATSYPLKDVFGNSHTLTGHQMFVRLNRALSSIGVAPILPAPASLAVPYPGDLTLTKAALDLSVNCVTWPTAAEKGSIYATAGISTGRASAGARFRRLGTFTNLTAAPCNFYAPYVAKFGTPIVGRKIFVRVVFTNATTGAQSLPSQSSITW